MILDYNDSELANFHLLNEVEQEIQIDSIERLNSQLNEALKKEWFEEAERLKTKINNLKNKK